MFEGPAYGRGNIRGTPAKMGRCMLGFVFAGFAWDPFASFGVVVPVAVPHVFGFIAACTSASAGHTSADAGAGDGALRHKIFGKMYVDWPSISKERVLLASLDLVRRRSAIFALLVVEHPMVVVLSGLFSVSWCIAEGW